MSVKVEADFLRSRMSLSHLGGREQGFGANLSALDPGGLLCEQNLRPVDLLHLRSHFGIPRFEGDGLEGVKSTGDAGK